MITKQIACQLFAWGYKLVDNVNKEFKIKSVHDHCFTVDDAFHIKPIPFGKIGKDYFILARSTYKLCEEIEGKVPLVECAKIAFPKQEAWSIENSEENLVSCMDFDFGYRNNGFISQGYAYTNVYISNQQSLFNHLYSLHFAINLPEGTWKEIE